MWIVENIKPFPKKLKRFYNSAEDCYGIPYGVIKNNIPLIEDMMSGVCYRDEKHNIWHWSVVTVCNNINIKLIRKTMIYTGCVY